MKFLTDQEPYKKPHDDYISYCAGGLIYDNGTDEPLVGLIHKLKPQVLQDKWNFIGGKVEEGETVSDAMEREFREEAGVTIPKEDWRPFCNLMGNNWGIMFFVATVNQKTDIKTMEAEEVKWFTVSEALKLDNLAPNLKFLLPMALDKDDLTSLVFTSDYLQYLEDAPAV